MEQIPFYIGLLIIAATVYSLIRGYDTRTVLLSAGFLMAIVSMKPMLAFTAFSDRMVFGGLIEPILSVMGFAYVMRFTKCDAHLIHLLAGGLRYVGFLIIPLTTLVTAFINISLTSAAGVSAAVGSIMIPMLISTGVRPALAAAAVYAGTFGSILSPGNAHNAFISGKLMDAIGQPHMPVMDVVAVVALPAIVALCISATGVTVYGIVSKENKGYVPDKEMTAKIDHSNILYAIMPILPIAILICASSSAITDYVPMLKGLRISHAMLIGAFLGILVTLTNPAKAVSEFFKGTGDVYASVMGIIISAAVFVGGLKACGATDAFNEMLRNSGDMARWAATWGPLLLSVLMGSGDAATLAFNESVTPHAVDFGMEVVKMGSLANLAGALGRTMSPLAGGIIVCAGIAGVPPLQIAKRTAGGMIIAGFVVMFMLT